jgi:hypothetical protein
VTVQPLDTLTYDSPNRSGVFIEAGDSWVRYTIYDPRPMRRDGAQIAIASVLASVGILLLLPVYLRGYYGFMTISPYLPLCWVCFGMQVRRIVARRKHGCAPTMIEASPAGLRVAYFHESLRDASMPAQGVQAMCVRKMRKAGGSAWFWGLDFIVAEWAYYRLVFVATEADLPEDMARHLTWKLGFSQMLPVPPISTQMRPLNTAE